MAKNLKIITAKSKSNLLKILLVIAALLMLSVLVPAIFPNATGVFGTIVGYFVAVNDHFVSFWMIYTFVALIVLASLKK